MEYLLRRYQCTGSEAVTVLETLAEESEMGLEFPLAFKVHAKTRLNILTKSPIAIPVNAAHSPPYNSHTPCPAASWKARPPAP
jgi:hypothetical protein